MKSNQILSSNPSKFYQYARSLRPSNPTIEKLESGGYVFHGEDVADGFFLAMSNLKNPSSSSSKPSSGASLPPAGENKIPFKTQKPTGRNKGFGDIKEGIRPSNIREKERESKKRKKKKEKIN